MDPAAVVAILVPAIASLFGALMLLVRMLDERSVKRETEWKALYMAKDAELAAERKEMSADARETAASLRELAEIVRALPELTAFLSALPKRRDDFMTHEQHRGRT